MRSTVLAYEDEYDEVSVSSTEVLEVNVISTREALKKHKTDFKEFRTEMRAAIARLDGDIETAVTELRTEIRAMAARAESDLKSYAARVDVQFSEIRKDHKEFREKVDKGG
jgi:predicted  nucleic acid-binding Zn-ribbon protein